MTAHIPNVLRPVGTSRGHIGVLVATNRRVDEVTAALRSAVTPVVSLRDYDGEPVDAVKVGTIKHASGLEFEQVLLAHVPSRLLAPVTGTLSATARERRGFDRRELYVDVTRARDGQWVAAQGWPSPFRLLLRTRMVSGSSVRFEDRPYEPS